MIQWFVAHTRPQSEAQAEYHLCRQGFEVYLPRFLKLWRHARRREWVPRPLFPRYLFVRVDPERARWRSIRSTIGVSELVCRGDVPVPVPPAIVSEIRAREDENGMVAMNSGDRFRPGDRVQIATGALCEQVGLFECRQDDERVIVLLELLGRQVRVRVPVEAVHAYA